MRSGRIILSSCVTGLVLSPLVNHTPALAQCEIAALRANDGETGDFFGYSLSLGGDLLVVGACFDDDGGMNAGAAYVLRRDGMNWVEEAKLTAPDVGAGDCFGTSVAHGNGFVVVGASQEWNYEGHRTGSVNIFRFDGAIWVPRGKLIPTEQNDYRYLGKSVALDRDTLIAGAPGWLVGYGGETTRTGNVYVFQFTGKNWIEEDSLTASDGAAKDAFGYSTAISGSILLVGAPLDDDAGTDSGSAYVFRRDGTGWVEEAKITPGDGTAYDRFGYSVSIDGDLAVVGAWTDDDAEHASGSVYVFRRDGADWLEEAKLLPRDAERYKCFGSSVSVSGDYLIVGARGDDVFAWDSGSAYVFRYDGVNWVEEAKLLAGGREDSRRFGFSVDFDGVYAAIGATWTHGGQGPGSTGEAYVYQILGGPDCDAEGINNACEPDCNGNDVADDCDIAGATSEDCNNNDIPDDCEPDEDCNGNVLQDICDIAAGTSEDCNSNSIPDECEPDCNGNGVADSCDIAEATSGDCNDNGMPDDCESDEDCNVNGTQDICDLVAGTSPDCNYNAVPDECDIATGASDDVDGDGVPDECRPFFALVPVPPPSSVGPYPPSVHIIDREIFLPAGGGRVWLEIKAGMWRPPLDCEWQATIDSSGYCSGSGDPLAPATESCDEEGVRPDDACENALGPGSWCDDGFCRPGFQDVGRSDFVIQLGYPYSGLFGPDYVYGSAVCWQFFCVCASDERGVYYGGTLVLDIPPDAQGTYTIGFDPKPDRTFIHYSSSRP